MCLAVFEVSIQYQIQYLISISKLNQYFGNMNAFLEIKKKKAHAMGEIRWLVWIWLYRMLVLVGTCLSLLFLLEQDKV